MTSEEREEFIRLYDDSPDIIGNWGEIITASTLRTECRMRITRTLYIGRSQIDMVGVSEYGVFVIENKNYHGVVSGQIANKYWDVRYRPGGRIYKLYNPCLQNGVHGDVVRNMLSLRGFVGIPVFCPVIFNDMTELIIGGSGAVYKLSDFVEWYSGCGLKSLLLSDTCKELDKLFMSYADCSDEAKLAHVRSINEGLKFRSAVDG